MSSRSAQMAAAARAAHLEVDRPAFLFEDTMARRLLGEQAEELLSYHHKSGSQHPVLLGTRLAVTTRARFAEDRLAAAVSSGVSQYVILGAGLDSFAVRSTLGPGLAIFEVDEPQTSAWKGDVLRAAGLAIPANLHLVAGDLGRDPLIDLLHDAGLDLDAPAFVSWLGVTMYLPIRAIESTLRALAGLAPGSEIVFDHVLPTNARDAGGAQYAEFAESVGAANGEPWLTAPGLVEARRLVASAGLEIVGQPLLEQWVDSALWNRTDELRPSLVWAMAHARVPH